jgi:hypothetical protein
LTGGVSSSYAIRRLRIEHMSTEEADLLSWVSGDIFVDENTSPRRSSIVVLDGSNDRVVTPLGWRRRAYRSAGPSLIQIE